MARADKSMTKLEKGLVGGGIGSMIGGLLALAIWLIIRQNKHTRERLEVADHRAQVALASPDAETKALGVALEHAVADVRDFTWDEAVGPMGVGIGAGVVAGVASAYIAGAALGIAGVLAIAVGVALAAGLLAAYLFERADWNRVKKIETRLVTGTKVEQPGPPEQEAFLPEQEDQEGVELTTTDDPSLTPAPDAPQQPVNSKGKDVIEKAPPDSSEPTSGDDWVEYIKNPEQDPADSGTSFVAAQA